MRFTTLPPSAGIKLEILLDGVRYSDALGEAASHSFPNYYPYRFVPGECNPRGEPTAAIPYLLTLADETLVRIRGAADSPWSVTGSPAQGYRLLHDGQPAQRRPIGFAPAPTWLGGVTSDGRPMTETGVSLHGDMAVVNVAPGCEYFGERSDGASLRCAFCGYGAPGPHTRDLGQEPGRAELPAATLDRMGETLAAALDEGTLRHLYLVGGSMRDWRLEGRRYLQIARAVQEVNRHRLPVSCGSGALPDEVLVELHGEGLVDAVCFNLEVYSEPLFARIAPGKNRFVGYERWLSSLRTAVELWGRGRVYSAMVAGIELEPAYGLTPHEASELALRGAEELTRLGVIPIYSLYYPLGALGHRERLSELGRYFEALTLGYREVRRRHGVQVWDGFMCHGCAYMQLECDLDRAMPAVACDGKGDGAAAQS